VWLQWVESMKNKKEYELIYYSQYLDLTNLPSTTSDEMNKKNFEMGDFNQRMKNPE
jgi:hypothetical protein